MSAATRSRGSILPRCLCRSRALAEPPSSTRAWRWARSSTSARMAASLFLNLSEAGSTVERRTSIASSPSGPAKVQAATCDATTRAPESRGLGSRTPEGSRARMLGRGCQRREAKVGSAGIQSRFEQEVGFGGIKWDSAGFGRIRSGFDPESGIRKWDSEVGFGGIRWDSEEEAAARRSAGDTRSPRECRLILPPLAVTRVLSRVMARS